MIREISAILVGFRSCFTRTAAFNWFVTVVFGFIVRIDLCGASAFVRWLGIDPELYTAMLSFFRATSWQIKAILHRWCQIVLQRCPLPTIDDRLLLAVDGIKICKQAEKMPAVKRLHQESDNSGKAPYIYGHHWGVIGILAGWVKKTLLHPPLCRTA
jgi:hypothetical protein